MNALTYLYVPGDSSERLAKASSYGAHALIADLEDSVSTVSKNAARRRVGAWVAREHPGSEQRWVRVNSGESGVADIRAVWGPGLHGVCVPKASSAADLERVGEILTALEGDAPSRRTAIMPLIESAQGLCTISELAGSDRVERLHLGEIDLAADLGVDPDENGSQLLLARSLVVIASRARGLPSPVGGVCPYLGDERVLQESTVILRNLGFGARAVIHPRQIRVVHQVLAPSVRELETARRLVDTYDEARRRGRGVIRDERGWMVDEAVVRRSRDMLAREREGVT